MDAGLIGRIHGDFDRIDTSQFPEVRHERGNELRSTLTVNDEVENLSGTKIITGIAAEQFQSEVEKPAITEDGGVVENDPVLEVDTLSTSFATVPGEFVVIESSKHDFAFDIIGRAVDSFIEPMTLNLDALAADYKEDANFWMGGFYDHQGEASNGVAYGDNVFEDNELGNAVWDSKKNQLGLEMEYQGDELRIRLTESGYIQVFTSNDFDTLSLVRLINELILNYEKQPEDE